MALDPTEGSAGRSAAACAGARDPSPDVEPRGHDPAEADRLLLLARGAASPAEALELLRQAVAAAPTHAIARATFTQLLLREGVTAAKAQDKERARRHLRELSALTPGDERVWLWRATVAQGYTEALDCLTRVLAISPQHPQALAAMARLRERAGARAAARTTAPAPAPAASPAVRPAPATAPPAPPSTLRAVASEAGPVPGTSTVANAAGMVAAPPAAAAAAPPLVALSGPPPPPEPVPSPGAEAGSPALPRSVEIVAAPTGAPEPGAPGPVRRDTGSRRVPGPVPASVRHPGDTGPHLPPAFARQREWEPAAHVDTRTPPEPPVREPSAPGNLLNLFDRSGQAPPGPPAGRPRTSPATPIGFRPPSIEPPAPSSRDRLPRTDAHPVLPASATQPSAPSPAPQPSRGLVLVVDDSPTVLKVVEFELRKHRLDVVTAADGAAALSVLGTLTPDLVLLDINMPHLDGYQVCKEIRADDRTSRIPVVMLSGKDGFFDKIRGRLAGATSYITKPFEASALVDILEKYFPVRM